MIAKEMRRTNGRKKKVVRKSKENPKDDQGHWIGEKAKPSKYFGFIYAIINTRTDKKYIGRKQYWISTGRCKSRICDKQSVKWNLKHWKESSWRKYKGSSKHLKQDMREYDRGDYVFIILSQHYSKSELNYAEVERMVLVGAINSRLDNGEKEFFNKHIPAIKYIPKESVYGINMRRYYRNLFDKETSEKISKANSGMGNGRADRTIYLFANKDGRTFRGTRYDFYKRFNLLNTTVGKLVTGERKSTKGWTVKHPKIEYKRSYR